MQSDAVLDQYERASAWMVSKVPEATRQLDAATPCVGWDVRTLLNHMLQTQQYFVGSARGDDDVSPPSPTPPDILSDDPVHDFEQGRAEMLRLFADDEVRQRTGPTLGIAFADTLLHGWDVATATGQDATMPDGLAQLAFDTIHGRFTEEQRQGVFDPEVHVPPSASAQDKLLAYTGRTPSAR
jgi:uncharacterized protein (TIGR03086 family)